MTSHQHQEAPWRVRVDDAEGTVRGAGVLLGERYVLTCAHVVEKAGAGPRGPLDHVRVCSTECDPPWTAEARLVPGTWAYTSGTFSRGDVALLELDAPPGCDIRARLWKAPISGGAVRVYGFPRVEPRGVWADAELAGSAGPERGQLKKLDAIGPWIVPGYSGAGVMAKNGEFAGSVVGIAVADHIAGDARAAWMMPAEKILSYLPLLEQFTDGASTIVIPENGNGTGVDAGGPLAGPLRLALTRQLRRLLTDDAWAGTVVVSTGRASGVGSSWLARLARTSDPGGPSRAGSGAHGDTDLAHGSIDAAYDARGSTTREVCRYLTQRFGLPDGDGPEAVEELVHALLRRKPPACLIVDGVDRAQDPGALVAQLCAPLARRAQLRGLRVVLGFDGVPPAELPYDVWLDPAPLPPAAPDGAPAAAAVEEAVADLSRSEGEALAAYRTVATRFLAPPRLPRARAPRLAVRLAVAGSPRGDAGELAAVAEHARDARTPLRTYVEEVRRMEAERQDLDARLELHRVYAARNVGAEDLELGELYAHAARALKQVPVDLAAAGRRVPRYVAAVNTRIAAGRTPSDAVGEE
ncbi:serine protease [Streptomyces sp. NPDC056910]|uniref:S1 family peptidase n=1 Tax=unclassified Streptomyces TaxID=2593676 RepID=UPI0036C11484